MENPKDQVATNGFRRNLWLFVAYRLGISLLIFAPISLFFYQEMGFSLTEIGTLYAITMFSYLACDMLAGFIGDTIGYRVILVTGVTIQAGCYWVLAFNHWQWLVYVVLVLLGIGQAAVSGADIPLGAIGAKARRVKFDSVLRYSIAFAAAGECVVGIAASVLMSQWSEQAPRLGVIVQAVIYTTLILVPLAMGEKRSAADPLRQRTTLTPRLLMTRIRTGVGEFIGAIRFEMSTKEVKWLVAYGALIGCMLQTATVTLILPYFQEIQLEKSQIGLLWAGYNVLWMVVTLLSVIYERWLGRWGALVSLTVWSVLLNGAMATLGGAWGIAALAAFYCVRSIYQPIIQSYTVSVVRKYPGTLLSVASSVQVIMYGVMSIVLSYVSEHVSVRMAYGVSLVVYGVLGCMCLWRWQRVRSA